MASLPDRRELQRSVVDEDAFGSMSGRPVSSRAKNRRQKSNSEKAVRVAGKPRAARAKNEVPLSPLPDEAALAPSSVDEDAFGSDQGVAALPKTSSLKKVQLVKKAGPAPKGPASKKLEAPRAKSGVPLLPLPGFSEPAPSSVDEGAFGSD